MIASFAKVTLPFKVIFPDTGLLGSVGTKAVTVLGTVMPPPVT